MGSWGIGQRSGLDERDFNVTLSATFIAIVALISIMIVIDITSRKLGPGSSNGKHSS